MNGEAIFTEYLLPLTGVLVVIALVATVIGFLMSILTDPKSGIIVLATIAGLVVLYFIGYTMADSSVTAREVSNFGMNEELSKQIGGVLNMTYYLFIIAGIAVVLDVVQRLVKSIG